MDNFEESTIIYFSSSRLLLVPILRLGVRYQTRIMNKILKEIKFINHTIKYVQKKFLHLAYIKIYRENDIYYRYWDINETVDY